MNLIEKIGMTLSITFALLIAMPSLAQDEASPRRGSEVINLSDTIVGNQEQPTVLYIVPWKPADDTEILYLPLSSRAMDRVFGHVERVEHQRQVQFLEQLTVDSDQ